MIKATYRIMTLVKLRMMTSLSLILPLLEGEETSSEEPSVEKKLLLMRMIWDIIVMEDIVMELSSKALRSSKNSSG